MKVNSVVREGMEKYTNSIRVGEEAYRNLYRQATPQPQLTAYYPPLPSSNFHSGMKWILGPVYVEGRDYYAVTTFTKTQTRTSILPYYVRSWDDATNYLETTKALYTRAYERGQRDKQDEIQRALGLGDM